MSTLWELDRNRKSRLLKEQAFIKPSYGAAVNFALVYPNDYFIAMSSLGYHIIYNLLNSLEGVSCERFFSPPLSSEKSRSPALYSLETGSPLSDFDVIGFSVSFELDYIRIARTLSSGGIPLYSQEREKLFPLVIAGGAFSFYNPEPMALFFDAIFPGEAEETLLEFIKLLKFKEDFKDKSSLLAELDKIEGIYVPSFYSAGYGKKITPSPKFKKQWIRDLDKFGGSSCIITPDTEFSNMFLLELARGCKNHCAFCMVGHCFKPYRKRSLTSLKKIIDIRKNIISSTGLVAPDVGDYEYIDELCRYIIEAGIKLSFSSLNADRISETMLQCLADSGQKTITFAPETGNDRLRKECFKKTCNEEYLHAVEMSLDKGIKNFKFYFMIGLPGESRDDIEDIYGFISSVSSIVKREGRLYLSINQFIPKPGTFFERYPLETFDTIKEKSEFLKSRLKKIRNLKVKLESLKWSVVQALLAQGDREMAKIIFQVSQHEKENFQTWKNLLEKNNMDISFYVYRRKGNDEILPWEHITGRLLK